MKELSDYIISSVFVDPYVRYQKELYESILRSYSPSKLLDEVLKEFEQYHLQYYRIRPDNFDEVCTVAFICTPKDLDKIVNNEKFKSLLNLFNYTYTGNKTTIINGHERRIVYLEPNITGDYTKIVYNEWNGIVYHVTTQEHLKGILKTGLRPKGLNNKHENYYRTFDERIFLTGGPDWETNLLKITKDLDYEPGKVVILKIDLKKNSHKIRLFRDSFQQNGLGLYTKENIDKNCIIDYYGIE